ncbi:MAG: chemotaxis protein CheB [Chromatiales bacterium]|nr:chemotaxis protein CheB [Chromatiales bacterium]
MPMKSPSYYVCIGASAGGLEAIEAFFKHMPHDSGLAFVVVQHLSPDYKSLMAELLSKHTRMPVLRSEDGMQVQANHVYLIPPKKNLTIFHGKLLLNDLDATRGVNLPIDIFLRSLAEDQGEKAIAIILSGTGSDGTRGIRAIKEQGGMIMVQSEESAKFDGMPKSAINTGLPDFVLPPEEMPHLLVSFVKHPYASKVEGTVAMVTDEDALARIFALLRESSKLDFTYYKPSTVIRRIERRMTVNQIRELRDYARFLERYPAEVNTLYRELLIGVTSFFRDRETWEYLSDEVLPALIEQSGDRELRFWVAGCSTGEEAYTLAMVSREAIERVGKNADIKIFATDVDRDAVQRAGNGVYPESIVADLSPQLLTKYFQRKDDNFHIARHVREMVVFAPHNLLKDPPFTNIDLVSCRNLLIYLQPVLQKKALDLFSFSLNTDGVLFLGSSETVGDAADLFDPVHLKLRLFRSRGKRRLSDSQDMSGYAGNGQTPRSVRLGMRAGMRSTDEERLLSRLVDCLSQDYLPLTLVVSEQLELLHVIGDAEGFLGMPSGKMHNDVTRLAVKDIAIPLATGLQKAFNTGGEVAYTNIHIKRRNETHVVRMRIRMLTERKGHPPLAAVMIEPMEVKPGGGDVVVYDLDREAEQRIRDLEAELQFTRENLQATVEELETSNEELQATNEELLASNEELQSTNEELQSVNEELYTVNAEYQTKIAELSQLNNDLDNLLSGTGIATLFLDAELKVRRFTPALTSLCHITDGDVGRPLADVCHQVVDVDLPALARRVQIERRAIEQEVRTRDGRWYLLEIHPYRIGIESTGAVVMTLVEVTTLKRAQEALARTEARNALAQRVARFGVWEWDIVAGTLDWSDTIEPLFGLAPGGFRRSYEAFLDLVHPDDRERVQQAVGDCIERGADYDIEHRIVWPDGSVHWVAETGDVQRDDQGRPLYMTGMVRDVNERKLAELELDQSRTHYHRLFDEAPHIIWLLDADGRIRESNVTAHEVLGHAPHELLGMAAVDLLIDDGEDKLQRVQRGEILNGERCLLRTRDGDHIPVEISGAAELRDGCVVGTRIVLLDLREH